MEQILLTEDEIKGAVKLAEWQGLNFEATKTDCERIAKAQLKKVKNWLEIYCESGGPRRECGHCWQALLKEIE